MTEALLAGGQNLMDSSQHLTAPNTAQDLFLRRFHPKCAVYVEGHGESKVYQYRVNRLQQNKTAHILQNASPCQMIPLMAGPRLSDP